MIKDNMLSLVSVGVGSFRAFLEGHDLFKFEDSGLHSMTLSIATQTK